MGAFAAPGRLPLGTRGIGHHDPRGPPECGGRENQAIHRRRSSLPEIRPEIRDAIVCSNFHDLRDDNSHVRTSTSAVFDINELNREILRRARTREREGNEDLPLRDGDARANNVAVTTQFANTTYLTPGDAPLTNSSGLSTPRDAFGLTIALMTSRAASRNADRAMIENNAVPAETQNVVNAISAASTAAASHSIKAPAELQQPPDFLLADTRTDSFSADIAANVPIKEDKEEDKEEIPVKEQEFDFNQSSFGGGLVTDILQGTAHNGREHNTHSQPQHHYQGDFSAAHGYYAADFHIERAFDTMGNSPSLAGNSRAHDAEVPSAEQDVNGDTEQQSQGQTHRSPRRVATPVEKVAGSRRSRSRSRRGSNATSSSSDSGSSNGSGRRHPYSPGRYRYPLLPPGVIAIPGYYSGPPRAGDESFTQHLNRQLANAKMGGYLPKHLPEQFVDTSQEAFAIAHPNLNAMCVERTGYIWRTMYPSWKKKNQTVVAPRGCPPEMYHWIWMPGSASWAHCEVLRCEEEYAPSYQPWIQATIQQQNAYVEQAAAEAPQPSAHSRARAILEGMKRPNSQGVPTSAASQVRVDPISTQQEEVRKIPVVPSPQPPRLNVLSQAAAHAAARNGTEASLSVTGDGSSHVTPLFMEDSNNRIHITPNDSIAATSAAVAAGKTNALLDRLTSGSISKPPAPSLEPSNTPHRALENVGYIIGGRYIVGQPVFIDRNDVQSSTSKSAVPTAGAQSTTFMVASLNGYTVTLPVLADRSNVPSSAPKSTVSTTGAQRTESIKPSPNTAQAPVQKTENFGPGPATAPPTVQKPPHQLKNVFPQAVQRVMTDTPPVSPQTKLSPSFTFAQVSRPVSAASSQGKRTPMHRRRHNGTVTGVDYWGIGANSTVDFPSLAEMSKAGGFPQPSQTLRPPPGLPIPSAAKQTIPSISVSEVPPDVVVTPIKVTPKPKAKPVARVRSDSELKFFVPAPESKGPQILLASPRPNTPPPPDIIITPGTPPTPRFAAMLADHNKTTDDAHFLAPPSQDVQENPPIIKTRARTSKRRTEKLLKKAREKEAAAARKEMNLFKLGNGKVVLEKISFSVVDVDSDSEPSDPEEAKKVKAKHKAAAKKTAKGIEIIPGIEVNDNRSKDHTWDKDQLCMGDRFVISKGQLKEVDVEKKLRKEKEDAATREAIKLRKAIDAKGKGVIVSEFWEDEEDKIAQAESALASRRGSTTLSTPISNPVLMAFPGTDFSGWKDHIPERRPSLAESVASAPARPEAPPLFAAAAAPASFQRPGSSHSDAGAVKLVTPRHVPPPLNPVVAKPKTLAEIMAEEKASKPVEPAPTAPVTASWAAIAQVNAPAGGILSGTITTESNTIVNVRTAPKGPEHRFMKLPTSVSSVKHSTTEDQRRVVYILGVPDTTTLEQISDSVSSHAYGSIYKIEFGHDESTGLRLAGVLFRDVGEVVFGLHGVVRGAMGYHHDLESAVKRQWEERHPSLWPFSKEAPIRVFLAEYPEEPLMAQMHHSHGGHRQLTRRLCLVNTSSMHRDYYESDLVDICYSVGVKQGNVQKAVVHNFGNATIAFGSVEDAVLMRDVLLRMFGAARGLSVTFGTCPGEVQGGMKHKRDATYLRHLRTVGIPVPDEEEGCGRERRRASSSFHH